MNRAKNCRPAVDRSVSQELRARIFERDEFTCRVCGAVDGDPDPYYRGRTVGLTIGYIADRPKARLNEAGNLRTECTTCNEGLRKVPLRKSSRAHLLNLIRRAAVDDQRAVLAVLQRALERSA
jgi:hypothetical protein